MRSEVKIGIIVITFLAFAVWGINYLRVRAPQSCFPEKQRQGGSQYQLIWYHLNPPQPDTDFVLKAVNQYLKKKLNATLKLSLIEFKDYEEKLRTIVTSQIPFDICFTSSFIHNYSQNAVKGAFLELDQLLNQYGRGILKTVPALYFDSTRINGKLYAIPVNKIAANQWAVTFNRKYLDKYGLDIARIAKLEDLEPFLELIHRKEPGIIPYATCYASCHAFALPFNRVNEFSPGALYLDNRTGYRLFNDLECPEYLQYLRLMHRWFKAGYIVADAASRRDISDLEWFSGVSAYVPGTEFDLSKQFGFPVVTVTLRQPVLTNKDIGGFMAAISATSQNPIRAMQFLNLLYTDQYLYNLLVFGIEGQHYRKVAPHIIQRPIRGNQAKIRYGIEPFTLGNMDLELMSQEQDRNLAAQNRRFNQQAIRSPLLGFNFNPQPVAAEIEALTQVAAEFEGPLNTGSVDPDRFLPKAIAKYKAAGVDRVIAEEQLQLETWLKRNRK